MAVQNDLTGDQVSLGRVTVVTPGTPVVLTSTSRLVKSFTVQAENNAGTVTLGRSNLNTSTGVGMLYILQPYEAVTIRGEDGQLVDPSLYMLDAAGSSYTAVVSYEPT